MNENVSNVVNAAIKDFSPISIDEENISEVLQNCDPYPYLTTDNGICMLMKKKSGSSNSPSEFRVQPIASFVKVSHKLHNVDEESISIVLQIDNGVKRIEKEFDRTVLTKMEIRVLLTYGVRFLESYADALIRYLVMTETNADTLHIHSVLGWANNGNFPVFKCSEILCPSNSAIDLKSTYRGNLDLQPQGSLDVWLSMVKSEVIGNLPLTVTLLLAFASPILAYVTDTFDLGSIIFMIANESSKGKSTSAMLVTSTFSNPRLNCGTMRSFNSTQNSLVTFLSKASGIPVAFDEASAFSGNFDQLLYLLSSGVEKSRLDGNSEMKPEKSWKSVILTTSEFGLISDDTSANGLKARCFSIQDELTKSASNADCIKTTVTTNYGGAGKAYVQWLLDNKISSITDDYIKMKNVLINESMKSGHQTSPLTQRILSKLAVVLLAAHYASACFDLNIDIQGVQEYLLNMERKVSVKTDFAKSALDIVMQEISKNSSKFLTPDRPSGQNIVGKVTEEKGFKTIAILKTEYQAYCKKNKIQNPHKVLTKLKDEGILQCEADRLTRRVRLEENLPVQTCYVFQIPDTICMPSDRKTNLNLGKQLIPLDNINDTINF